MRMLTEDERKERRLAAEAQTVRLGVLIHDSLKDRLDDPPTQRVRCEVTYQEEGDIEHSGYWIVYVPELDPEGMSDDEAMEAHPVTLATEKLTDWADDNRDYVYFSIDDMYAA